MRGRTVRDEQLEMQYVKAKEVITRLQNRVAKLEKENARLRRVNNILMRAIEIALTIPSREKQDLHLKSVLEMVQKEGERDG